MKNMNVEMVKALFTLVACTDDIEDACIVLLDDKNDVIRWLEKVETPDLTRSIALDAFEAVFTRCQNAGWEQLESAMHAFSTMLVLTLPISAGAVNVQSDRQCEFLRHVILGQFQFQYPVTV